MRKGAVEKIAWLEGVPVAEIERVQRKGTDRGRALRRWRELAGW